MECPICINIVQKKQIFNCNACKYTNCIDCHKKYLLTSTQDPHCINCRCTIPYDIFIDKFNENWIFDKYKKHRYVVLWEREQSLIPQTVNKIGIEKNKKMLYDKKEQLNLDFNKKIAIEFNAKKDELLKELSKINNIIAQKRVEVDKECIKIDQELFAINTNIVKKVYNKFKYNYACPKETCKGFLNEEYKCEICDIIVCKKCYTEIEQDLKGPHECIPEMVETFNTIKKEAKPCPCCGQFISKISGCDQMFCTTCGSAFGWKSGLIEKGIIHNPHASMFFQNNPDKLLNYQNTLTNNAAENNTCRSFIPNNIIFEKVYKKVNNNDSLYLKEIYRRIAEFRQYSRNRYNTYINDNSENNNDIREKYVKNELGEKAFKQVLHLRDKKRYFKKQLIQTLLFTFEIAELLLWNIADANNADIIDKNIQLLMNLNLDTNKNINILCEKFKYKNSYEIIMYNSKFISV